MKKLLSALIAIAMLCSFTACTPSQGNGSSDAPSASQIEVQTETQAAEEPEVEKLEWVDFAQYSLEEDVPAKNIILLIGDGMGKNIIKASEVVKGDKLVMSGMPHSTTVTTYSQSVTDGKAEYTDSAAATAISTGIKTTNDSLGVDPDGEDVETICEFSQKLGMKTGLSQDRLCATLLLPEWLFTTPPEAATRRLCLIWCVQTLTLCSAAAHSIIQDIPRFSPPFRNTSTNI